LTAWTGTSGVRAGSTRPAAVLILAGVVISLVAGLIHPERGDPNDHQEVFTEYADSQSWITAHLGQFAGIAAIVFGLVFLYFG
jgi:hypothetical protein